jgi:hypothetical protein
VLRFAPGRQLMVLRFVSRRHLLVSRFVPGGHVLTITRNIFIHTYIISLLFAESNYCCNIYYQSPQNVSEPCLQHKNQQYDKQAEGRNPTPGPTTFRLKGDKSSTSSQFFNFTNHLYGAKSTKTMERAKRPHSDINIYVWEVM